MTRSLWLLRRSQGDGFQVTVEEEETALSASEVGDVIEQDPAAG